MRLTRAIMTVLILLFSTGAAHAVTPAGTVILNKASSSYTDGAVPVSITSNTVSLSVTQVYGIDVKLDGTAASPGTAVTAIPSGTAYLPYILTNAGNGPDRYALTLKNLAGDAAELAGLRVYIDANGDGLLQAGEPLYDNASPPALGPGARLYLLVAGEAPAGSAGFALANVEGASLGDPARTDADNVSRVDITSAGFVTAAKSADRSTVYAGDVVSFSVNFVNGGASAVGGATVTNLDLDGDGAAETAEGLLVSDALPQYMTYAAGSAAGIPSPGFPVYLGADGLWKKAEPAPGTVAAAGFFVPEDGAGVALSAAQAGRFDFAAVISPGSPDGATSNVASALYSDGGADKAAQTNRVFLTILSRVSIAVDDTDDLGASTGTGAMTDPDDLTVIDHAATGSRVSFVNEAWNLNTVPDTVELRYDAAASAGIPAGLSVAFYDTSGAPLPDPDGDGYPETGPIPPGAAARFETRVTLPAAAALPAFTVAVRGYSEADPSVTDLTFDRLLSGLAAEVQIMVEVAALIGGKATVPLADRQIVVHEYDAAGALVQSKIFLTDANGVVAFDENGNPFPLYNFLEDGFGYKVGLVGQMDGVSYYLSPFIKKAYFDNVTNNGDTYTSPNGDITITMANNVKLLMTPLDPAGFTFDANSAALVDGACVTFYRCADAGCSSYAAVDPALLDYYPDGATQQENPQVSGPSDAAGAAVGKGPGAYEFRFRNYVPAYDGWYFIAVDYGCGLPASDPGLAGTYGPVPLNPGAAWNPLSGSVYAGERFYIDKDFPGAILLRIPLSGGGSPFKDLDVKKAVNVSSASVGDLVEFRITAGNPNAAVTAYSAAVTDSLPRGLRYKPGSGTVDGADAEPAVSADGRTLTWALGDLAPGASAEVRFVAYVGLDAGAGRLVNSAFANAFAEASLTVPLGSNVGAASVDVKRGVFSDKAYVIGKVYVDADGDRVQDPDEEAVKGVKIYTEDGRYAVTDSAGKYHMDGLEPGTHVLKLDAASLPEGYAPAPTGARNMGDAGSLFADLFPGDMYSGVFRLVPSGAEKQAGTAGTALTAAKAIDAIFADANSDSLVIRYRVTVKNCSDAPVYEAVYSPGGGDVLVEGTSYLDGSPLVPRNTADGGQALEFPVVEAGREMVVTYNSYLPGGRSGMPPELAYRPSPPAGPVAIAVKDACRLHSGGTGVYTISAPSAAGGRGLTPEETDDLAAIVEALRKYGYDQVVVSAGAGGSDQLLAYLRENLIDMDKVTAREERPGRGGDAGRAEAEGGADGVGAKARLVPRTPGAGPAALPGLVPKGMYTLSVDTGGRVSGGLSGVKLFMRIPEGFSYISNSAAAGGRPLDAVLKSGFFIVGAGGDAEVSGEVTMSFLLMEDAEVEGIPFAVFGKDPEGSVVTVDSRYFGGFAERAAEVYAGEGGARETVPRKAAPPEWRILYPAADRMNASRQTDVKISLPAGARYDLKVNGEAVDARLVGETATDGARGVVTIQYVSVPLAPGANRITLDGPSGVMDEKTLTVPGEVSALTYRIAPETPPADGKTPVYVVVELRDAEGRIAARDASLEASVDKGDVYDYEAGAYVRGPLEGFRARAVAGRAVIRLSPSATTETRTVSVRLDRLDKEIEVRWYPERRAWIVAGEVEAAMGLNRTKGAPPKSSGMPFDHTDGESDAELGGGVFAKGTVKDYTLTFRYKEEKDEDALLRQNVPSTEEGQHYPVYGDASEQFFEAQGRERFFFKAEKGLSFVQYGDFATGFGTDLEFNRYERTMSGGLVNVEQDRDYRVRGFISSNDQVMTRQTMPGRGISGPYFLGRTDLVEFSERVWIEVRDRYNQNLVKETRQMARYADYQVNYDEGFVLFHEPVRVFDDGFNPVFIQVVFESRNTAGDNLMYGVRGEKMFADGRLRVGASGASEENPISRVNVAGVDVVWKTDSLTVAAEAAATDNFNQATLDPASGSAYRAEAAYHKGGDGLRAYYKKVTDGFQNPSATSAESAYETYGASGQVALNEEGTVLRAEYMTEKRSAKRVQAAASVEHRIYKSLSANAGVRWNRETSAGGVLDNILALYGLSFSPLDTLGIAVGREDVLKGASASSFYPAKTFAQVNYAVTKDVRAFVQAEYQEKSDKDQLLTSVGLDSRIGDNTTAFAKYSMGDSVSGWRNSAHFGINHMIPVSEGLSLEGGAESTLTLAGGGNDAEDFTALRAGAVYTQKEAYKLTGRYEVRLGRQNTEQLATAGGSVRATEDLTLFVNERYFDSAYKENDLLFGAAYRPVRVDRLNALFKLRFKERSAETSDSRVIGSANVNYRHDPKTDVMGQYACKLVSLSGAGGTFTDMVRVRVLRDLCDWLEASVHAGVVRQHDTKTWAVSWGPELGVKVVKNLWVSAGYNFDGFTDKDFEDADTSAQGPYLKVRFKFDEDTASDLLGLAGLK